MTHVGRFAVLSLAFAASSANAVVYWQKVGEGRIERTQPGCYSADEGVDVGQVTVALGEQKAADRAAAEQGGKEAALKTAVAD